MSHAENNCDGVIDNEQLIAEVSEHLPEIIDDALLNEALSISWTLWRVYSISLIKKSPNKLIENLILSDQVKKHDILCLSTLINQIPFDNHLLFKLAFKLILNRSKISCGIEILSTSYFKSKKLYQRHF